MTAREAPTKDIGRLSDVFGVGGGIDASFVDVVEVSADLQWPLSVSTYSRMRRDPQLAAIMSALTLPIRRASWHVDPAGVRDEVAQLVADDLGLPVLGHEDEPGPARRRGVQWDEHLRLALLSLVFGHMPFEQRYEILDNQARLAALSERMPNTIRQIVLTPDGMLAGIKQDVTGDLLIPENRLVWYCHDREGAAWQGQSLLRPAFGPWLLKHEMWRVHATSIRRFGMGVPGVEAPPGATPQQVAEAQQLASAARVGETGGMGLPAGFKFNLTGLSGSVPDALGFIRYLDEQMAGMVLAGFLTLGGTPNGSRALGEAFIDVFTLATQAIANEHATVTTGLAVQMVDYNWGEDEPAPRVCVSDVGTRQEVTAESLSMLLDAGALSADPELEAYVRSEWGLPERSTPAGTYDPTVGYVDQGPPPALEAPATVAAATGVTHHWKHGWIPLDGVDTKVPPRRSATNWGWEKLPDTTGDAKVTPIEQVLPHAFDWVRDETLFDPSDEHTHDLMMGLIDSLEAEGIKTPIVMHYDPETGETSVLDGNHRLAAAEKLGLKHVPVVWWGEPPPAKHKAAADAQR